MSQLPIGVWGQQVAALQFGGISMLRLTFWMTLLLMAAVPASPTAFTQTVAFADVNNGVSCCFVDSGQLFGPTSAVAGPLTAAGGGGNQTAFASGSADYGVLRAFASSYNSASAVQSQAYAIAKFFTVIHVSNQPGFSLPNGTPVVLLLTAGLGDTLSSIVIPGGTTTINARASLDGNGIFDFAAIHDTFQLPAATKTFSISYNTVIGANLPAGAQLVAAVGPQFRDEVANALNTGLFMLDVMTPGATYTSDSGTLFATSGAAGVPEPGSFILAGIGLVIAMRQGRSRKRA